VADDAMTRIGAMLEDLGARFELVVEAVSGFGSRLDQIRQELVAQFAEVGSQVRFLSDQIAENRRGIGAMRADLGAEMVRLGETLGRTRVEFREQITSTEAAVRGEVGERSREVSELMRAEAERVVQSAGARIEEDSAATQDELRRGVSAARGDVADAAKTLKREISASADATVKKLATELSKTNKVLATLARKFDRFDDRITVQSRDQDQRLRKLEQRGKRAG
jgi:hypothetical protein